MMLLIYTSHHRPPIKCSQISVPQRLPHKGGTLYITIMIIGIPYSYVNVFE